MHNLRIENDHFYLDDFELRRVKEYTLTDSVDSVPVFTVKMYVNRHPIVNVAKPTVDYKTLATIVIEKLREMFKPEATP